MPILKVYMHFFSWYFKLLSFWEMGKQITVVSCIAHVLKCQHASFHVLPTSVGPWQV